MSDDMATTRDIADAAEVSVVQEVIFENILTPMPVTPQEDLVAQQFLLQPVTQVDTLLRENGIPIVGVSPSGDGFTIHYEGEPTKDQIAAAEQLLKSQTFEPKKATSLDELASRLTDKQVATAMRYAAAREFLSNTELANSCGVDIYVSVESATPADSDDLGVTESAV